MIDFSTLTPKEWETVEKEEHDMQYENSFPFHFKNYKIDPQQVIWWQDYCYKKGRRKDRGHKAKRLFELMDLNQLKGKKILDVGCGNGQYSVFFALLGAEAYGFDISPVGVQVARKMAEANGVSQHCHFSVQNASHMDFPDEFFDIVLYYEVLHHAIKYPNIKEETYRVVKNGGKVFCVEGLEGNIFFKIGRFFTMHGQETKGDVELTISDFQAFAEGCANYRLELMSLFFMSKRIFRAYMNAAPVRWLLFLMKKADDIVLSLFPFLRRYCGECILVMEK